MFGMKYAFRRILILLALSLVTALYLNGTRIFVPRDESNPALSNFRYRGPDDSWGSLLFGDRAQWGSMRNYLRLSAEYESRRNYGLLDPATAARYHGLFAATAGDALAGWQSERIRAAGRFAGRGLESVVDLRSLRDSKSPLLLVGFVAAAYAGRTLRYDLGDSNAVAARTDLRGGGFEGQYLGWNNSALGASAGGTYGGAGEPLSFSLSKQVAPGVSVNYDRGASDSVGVNYSAGF